MCQCKRKKSHINLLPFRKTKGNVRYSKHRFYAQPLFYKLHSFQCFHNFFLLSRSCQRQTVNINVFFRNTIALSLFHDTFGYGISFLGQERNSVFVQSKSYHCCTIFLYQRQYFFKNGSFTINRIDNRFSIVNSQCSLNNFCIRRINLKRHINDALKLFDDFNHKPGFINFRKSHINIQNMGSRFHLRNSLR